MNRIRRVLLSKLGSGLNSSWQLRGQIIKDRVIIIIILWMRVTSFRSLGIWKINRVKLLLKVSWNSRLNRIELRRLPAERIGGQHREGGLPLDHKLLRMSWYMKTLGEKKVRKKPGMDWSNKLKINLIRSCILSKSKLKWRDLMFKNLKKFMSRSRRIRWKISLRRKNSSGKYGKNRIKNNLCDKALKRICLKID